MFIFMDLSFYDLYRVGGQEEVKRLDRRRLGMIPNGMSDFYLLDLYLKKPRLFFNRARRAEKKKNLRSFVALRTKKPRFYHS